MNVVDSSGWLEYFADAAQAEFFAEAIQDVDGLLVPTIVILEVFKRSCQQRDEEAALEVVGHMEQGEIVALDRELAISAAILGTKMKLALADSVVRCSGHRSTPRRDPMDYGQGLRGNRRRTLLSEVLRLSGVFR